MITRSGRKRLGSIFILAGMVTVTAGGRAASASNTIWSVVPTPNPAMVSVSNDVLDGVSALADNDVWAVGNYSSSVGNNVQHTLTEHWNGTAWSVVRSPNVGTQGSELLGVAAISDTDVWAVGNMVTSATSNGNRTLVEHFDGTAWSVVPSPNPSTQGDDLTAVAALAPDNVWAVGYFENNSQSALLPLVLHWDGTAWLRVTTGLAAATGTVLHAITAIAPNDIWAVGEAGFGSNVELHWNGARWSVTNASFPTGGQESLGGVAAVSSSNVWAVGSYAPSTFADLQTLILHWDGRSWTKVTSPDLDAYFNLLFGVAAISATDAWAVGYAYNTNGLGFSTLTVHWDGTQWTIVPSPMLSGSELRGVVVSGPTALWGAGSYDSLVKGNPGLRTLALHTTQG